MRRDLLLLGEMIDAGHRAHELVAGISVDDLAADRLRRDDLLWNLTVLGEASGQLSADLKAQHPHVGWDQRVRLRNRIVNGYWSIDLGVIHTTASELLPDFVAKLRSVERAIAGTSDDR